jgi:hypothetical protein
MLLKSGRYQRRIGLGVLALIVGSASTIGLADNSRCGQLAGPALSIGQPGGVAWSAEECVGGSRNKPHFAIPDGDRVKELVLCDQDAAVDARRVAASLSAGIALAIRESAPAVQKTPDSLLTQTRNARRSVESSMPSQVQHN